MASITKTWKKAGSLPGQYQRLRITYLSRNGDKVNVKYELYIRSLGYDYYHYNIRHNKFSIMCPSSTVKVTNTYQAYGSRASKSFSGTFTVNNVSSSSKELTFYYQNARVWASKTNSWDPRSTGVVSKTSVGTLKIPQNKQYSVEFDPLLSDNTHEYECYKGEKFTIPNLNHTSHYFNFRGWTLNDYAKGYKSKEKDIPLEIMEGKDASIDYTAGKTITVNKNLDFYGVWRAKTCTYNFYSEDGKQFKDLTKTHKWGTKTTLPNLDKAKQGKYKEDGYAFSGWQCRRTDGTKKTYKLGKAAFSTCEEWPLKNSGAYIVNFFEQSDAKENEIVFHLPNNVTYSYDYETDDKFGMYQVLSDHNLKTYTMRPGYKLMGWSTTPTSTNGLGVSMPDEAFNTKKLRKVTKSGSVDYYTGSGFRVYPYTGRVIFDYQDFKKVNSTHPKLDLYPYYEYYTTTYIFTSEGKWELAMPYIFTSEGKWEPALAYVFTSEGKWEL